MCDDSARDDTEIRGDRGLFALPRLQFSSEWFKCNKCPYSIQLLLPQDHPGVRCKNPDIDCDGWMTRV